MLALASSIALTALALWLGYGLLARPAYRWLRPRLRTVEPAQASTLLLAWLALPLFAALLTCYLLYSPWLAQWFVAGHCHGDGCHAHGPTSTLALFPAAVLACWAAFRLARCLLREWLPARRLCAQLSAVGEDRGDYISLDAESPAAFTLGWLRPRIFISTGMQSRCGDRDIACILRHEQAHRRRYDNLRLLLARLLTAPWPRRWPQAVLEDLQLSCEQACDQSAARQLSHEDVAAALLRVARLQRAMPPVASLAFAGNRTEQRVHALLAAPLPPMARARVFTIAALALLLVLAVLDPLHRAIELLP